MSRLSGTEENKKKEKVQKGNAQEEENSVNPTGTPLQLLALTYMGEISQPEYSEGSALTEKEQQFPDCIVQDADELGNSMAEQESDIERQDEEKREQTEEGSSEVLRVKAQRWQPPEGMRRCGHNCSGCSKRCTELGLENCQNCHMRKNTERNTGEKVTGNVCYNRGECVNLRTLRGRSMSRGGVTKARVGSQSIVFKPGQVAEKKDAIDRKRDESEKKRGREETGTTPEKEEQTVKTPKTVAKISKASKSKLVKPGQIQACEVRGEKPPTSTH